MAVSVPGRTGIHFESSIAAEILRLGLIITNLVPASRAFQKCQLGLPPDAQAGLHPSITMVSAFTKSKRSFPASMSGL